MTSSISNAIAAHSAWPRAYCFGHQFLVARLAGPRRPRSPRVPCGSQASTAPSSPMPPNSPVGQATVMAGRRRSPAVVAIAPRPKALRSTTAQTGTVSRAPATNIAPNRRMVAVRSAAGPHHEAGGVEGGRARSAAGAPRTAGRNAVGPCRRPRRRSPRPGAAGCSPAARPGGLRIRHRHAEPVLAPGGTRSPRQWQRRQPRRRRGRPPRPLQAARPPRRPGRRGRRRRRRRDRPRPSRCRARTPSP